MVQHVLRIFFAVRQKLTYLFIYYTAKICNEAAEFCDSVFYIWNASPVKYLLDYGRVLRIRFRSPSSSFADSVRIRVRVLRDTHNLRSLAALINCRVNNAPEHDMHIFSPRLTPFLFRFSHELLHEFSFFFFQSELQSYMPPRKSALRRLQRISRYRT